MELLFEVMAQLKDKPHKLPVLGNMSPVAARKPRDRERDSSSEHPPRVNSKLYSCILLIKPQYFGKGFSESSNIGKLLIYNRHYTLLCMFVCVSLISLQEDQNIIIIAYFNIYSSQIEDKSYLIWNLIICNMQRAIKYHLFCIVLDLAMVPGFNKMQYGPLKFYFHIVYCMAMYLTPH